MKPEYKLSDFLEGCMAGVSKAYVIQGAMKTAEKDFNLYPQQRVLEFIGNGGLAQPHFINSKPWDNNPNPENEIMVDAYGFFSGFNYGYVAFFRPVISKWIIKSFKKNTDPDPRNLALREGLGQIWN